MKKIFLFLLLVMSFAATVFCIDAQVAIQDSRGDSIYSAIADFINNNVTISSLLLSVLAMIYAIIEYLLGQTKLIKANSVIALMFNFIAGVINAILGKKKSR